MRDDFVRAAHEAFFVFFLEVGDDVVGGDVEAAELDDVGQFGVVDVQQVAQAAQYIVVNHGDNPVRGVARVAAPCC
ncbi:hypothetical protein D3C84_749850 [compost metagenome]